jgi:hypothetical protein
MAEKMEPGAWGMEQGAWGMGLGAGRKRRSDERKT